MNRPNTFLISVLLITSYTISYLYHIVTWMCFIFGVVNTCGFVYKWITQPNIAHGSPNDWLCYFLTALMFTIWWRKNVSHLQQK
jgi:hypothetical protein